MQVVVRRRMPIPHLDYHGLSLTALHPSTMRMQHLHLILALAQGGSLRAAAECLNVTQPALTKSLRQLEEELVDRSNNIVT